MALVRRIGPGDGPLLRDVRLLALQTDPDAFGSSYQREVDRSDEQWEDHAARAATNDDQYLAVADLGDRFVGMAGGYQPEEAPTTRELYGMWVAPGHRSRGIGRQLVAAVKKWSHSVGAETLLLWVVLENIAAHRLYTDAGFVETGESQPLPSNPELLEVRMSAPLT